MTEKDNIFSFSKTKMATDESYYTNVFKKTERILGAVTYITSFIEDTPRNQRQIQTLDSQVTKTHILILETLTWHPEDLRRRVHELQQQLLALESTLTLAVAARVVGTDVVDVITTELDLVQRYLKNHYSNSTIPSLLGSVRPSESLTRARPASPAPRRARPVIPKNDLSSDAVLVYSQLQDRTTRIKTVLEAKPNATIKDLTDIITDVSAKTIQRDLNSLIERGEVIRQGERRWSTYSIVS